MNTALFISDRTINIIFFQYSLLKHKSFITTLKNICYMRCIKVKILYTLVVAIVTILVILLSNAYPSILFIDTFGKYFVYAQTIESALPSTQPLEVQIISPNKGQQVPINSNSLSISGTSNDDLAKDCRVSVIVNDIRPYQPAKATGPDGANDYSKWNFLLTSNYASIKEGPDNKITAKLVCHPNLTKWYSVNVTGIGQRTTTTTAATTTTEAADKLKQTTPSVTTEAANNTPFSLPLPSEASNNNNIINESNTITNNATSSKMTTIPATSSSGKTLSISVDVDKNVIALGDAQTIEATAYDTITHQ